MRGHMTTDLCQAWGSVRRLCPRPPRWSSSRWHAGKCQRGGENTGGGGSACNTRPLACLNTNNIERHIQSVHSALHRIAQCL